MNRQKKEIRFNSEIIRENFARIKRAAEEGARELGTSLEELDRVAQKAERHARRLAEGQDEDTQPIKLPH